MNDIPGPGKFERNESASLAEYLNTLCLDGGYDESFGSVDENGWFALIRSVDKQNIEAHLKSEYGTEPIVAWAYILEEDPNGFFKYWGYNTDDVLVAWNTIMRMYNAE